MNNNKIEREIKEAEAYIEKHEILQTSPGDLRRTGVDINDYLNSWSPEDQELWQSYYSDEV